MTESVIEGSVIAGLLTLAMAAIKLAESALSKLKDKKEANSTGTIPSFITNDQCKGFRDEDRKTVQQTEWGLGELRKGQDKQTQIMEKMLVTQNSTLANLKNLVKGE